MDTLTLGTAWPRMEPSPGETFGAADEPSPDRIVRPATGAPRRDGRPRKPVAGPGGTP